MHKFQIVLTQVKTLVVEIEAKDSDAAVYAAKEKVSGQFDNRLGAILVADARAIDDDDNS